MHSIPVKVFNSSSLDLPAYATEGAAAMDVRSTIDTVVPSKGKSLVPTGLFVDIPAGYKIDVIPRSGLANKEFITVLNTPGCIDFDYHGEINVLLVNLGDEDYHVTMGERIAQISITPVLHIGWVPVQSVESFTPTARGAGGFGHTGKQ